MITADDKSLIKEIIFAFEQGEANPPYDQIFIYNDGPHGVRQLTLAWGLTQYDDFKDLFTDYIDLGGKYAPNFKSYLPKLNSPSTVNDKTLKALLLTCAKSDEVFRGVMDSMFDKKYWAPALKWFTANGLTTTLSMAVIMDSYIQSGSIRGDIRQMFDATLPANGGEEKAWITQYVDARYNWLKNSSKQVVRNTTYRMQFFKDQIAADNWVLNTPLRANDVKIV